MARGVVLVAVSALLLPAPAAARAGGHKVGAVKAFDTTATVDDPAWFARMYARGFRLYVMHSTAWGTCTPWPNTQTQLGLAVDAGLKIAVYTRDPRCWRQGIAAAGPYASRLEFFALDVETVPGVRVTQAMVDGVASMGVRPVIYSGAGMWPEIMGAGNTRFAGVPLWDTDTGRHMASLSSAPSLVSPAPVKYGGWNAASTMRKGVQQALEVSIGGIAVDVSSFDGGFLR